jgi:hypothetical protein
MDHEHNMSFVTSIALIFSLAAFMVALAAYNRSNILLNNQSHLNQNIGNSLEKVPVNQNGNTLNGQNGNSSRALEDYIRRFKETSGT